MRYKNAVAVLIKILAVLTICGGIILHGADNLQKAQYSVHT